MQPVEKQPGIFVRRLTFREFSRVQSQTSKGEEQGDDRNTAFACALLSACARNEDGSPVWADYEAVASDERPLLVSDVAEAAIEVNGLADSGNASPDSQS